MNIEEINQELRRLAVERKSIKNEIARLDNEKNEVDNQLNELNIQNDRINNELNGFNNERENANQEAERLSQEKAGLEQRKQEILTDTTIEDANRILAERENAINDNVNSLIEEARQTYVENRRTDYDENYVNSLKENAKSSDPIYIRYKDLITENNEIEQNIARIVNEQNICNENISQLENSINQCNENIAKINENKKELDEKVKSIENSQRENEGQLDNIDKNITDFFGRKIAHSKISSNEKEIADLNKIIAVKQEQFNKLNNQYINQFRNKESLGMRPGNIVDSQLVRENLVIPESEINISSVDYKAKKDELDKLIENVKIRENQNAFLRNLTDNGAQEVVKSPEQKKFWNAVIKEFNEKARKEAEIKEKATAQEKILDEAQKRAAVKAKEQLKNEEKQAIEDLGKTVDIEINRNQNNVSFNQERLKKAEEAVKEAYAEQMEQKESQQTNDDEARRIAREQFIKQVKEIKENAAKTARLTREDVEYRARRDSLIQAKLKERGIDIAGKGWNDFTVEEKQAFKQARDEVLEQLAKEMNLDTESLKSSNTQNQENKETSKEPETNNEPKNENDSKQNEEEKIREPYNSHMKIEISGGKIKFIKAIGNQESRGEFYTINDKIALQNIILTECARNNEQLLSINELRAILIGKTQIDAAEKPRNPIELFAGTENLDLNIIASIMQFNKSQGENKETEQLKQEIKNDVLEYVKTVQSNTKNPNIELLYDLSDKKAFINQLGQGNNVNSYDEYDRLKKLAKSAKNYADVKLGRMLGIKEGFAKIGEFFKGLFSKKENLKKLDPGTETQETPEEKAKREREQELTEDEKKDLKKEVFDNMKDSQEMGNGEENAYSSANYNENIDNYLDKNAKSSKVYDGFKDLLNSSDETLKKVNEQTGKDVQHIMNQEDPDQAGNEVLQDTVEFSQDEINTILDENTGSKEIEKEIIEESAKRLDELLKSAELTEEQRKILQKRREEQKKRLEEFKKEIEQESKKQSNNDEVIINDNNSHDDR